MKWHVSINNVLDHLVTSAFLNETVKIKCVHSDPITNWLRTAACMNVSCWSARRERVSMWTTTTRGANTQCRNVEAEQLRHKNVSCLLINTELIQQRRVGERARKEAEKNGERWTSRLNGSSNTTETGAIQREHWSSELEVKRFPVTGRGYRLRRRSQPPTDHEARQRKTLVAYHLSRRLPAAQPGWTVNCSLRVKEHICSSQPKCISLWLLPILYAVILVVCFGDLLFIAAEIRRRWLKTFLVLTGQIQIQLAIYKISIYICIHFVCVVAAASACAVRLLPAVL